jgi:uncharacterized protein
MNRAFQSCTDAIARLHCPASAGVGLQTPKLTAPGRSRQTILAIILLAGTATGSLAADGAVPKLAATSVSPKAAYCRGDYARAIRELAPAAAAGNARAQGQLGFMYENGFGVPQNYAAAADLCQGAANQGDVFAQSRLGLSYDKGHGVPQSVVLSYAWLNLAAARASGRQRDFYRRLRDAVASKMTFNQIAAGQQLAFEWTSVRW